MTQSQKESTNNLPTTSPNRIIKLGTCPTLSGKGKLEYHVGCSADSEINFLVAFNTGGGYFSPEWVSLKVIKAAMEQAPKPLTSFALSPLFKGKSVNTPSFLFAVLLAEGLVQRDSENTRAYVVSAHDHFISEMNNLIASNVDLKIKAKIAGKGVIKHQLKVDDVPILGTPSKIKLQK